MFCDSILALTFLLNELSKLPSRKKTDYKDNPKITLSTKSPQRCLHLNTNLSSFHSGSTAAIPNKCNGTISSGKSVAPRGPLSVNLPIFFVPRRPTTHYVKQYIINGAILLTIWHRGFISLQVHNIETWLIPANRDNQHNVLIRARDWQWKHKRKPYEMSILEADAREWHRVQSEAKIISFVFQMILLCSAVTSSKCLAVLQDRDTLVAITLLVRG